MSHIYLTKNGDTVDEITWKQYGTRAGLILETVLNANPGIADYGPVLPAGLSVLLPDISKPAAEKSIKLWD